MFNSWYSTFFIFRKQTKLKRNDIIDLMIDAMKNELNGDDVNDDQYDQDARLSHRFCMLLTIECKRVAKHKKKFQEDQQRV